MKKLSCCSECIFQVVEASGTAQAQTWTLYCDLVVTVFARCALRVGKSRCRILVLPSHVGGLPAIHDSVVPSTPSYEHDLNFCENITIPMRQL